jgi:2'-5' RNA ligase
MDLLARMQSSDSSDDGKPEKCGVVSIGNNKDASKRDGTTDAIRFCDAYLTKKQKEDSNSQGRINPTNRHKKGMVDIMRFSQTPPETFQRSKPHRRGHWAGHVKIPVTHSLSLETRKSSVQQFQQLLERQGHSGTIVEHEDVHISLSKPFSLQVSQVESFVQQLQTLLLQDVHVTYLHIDTDAIVLVNDEETRSFWCWTVHTNPTLLQLIRHVDSVLARYQHPAYYNPPQFHISIASFPGMVNIEEEDYEEDDDQHHCDDASRSSTSTTGATSLTVQVNQIQCTFGTTKQFTIPLKRSNS